jgi:biopolymer transport protein ExbB
MKNIVTSLLLSAAVALSASPVQAQDSLDKLLEKVKQNRSSELRINKKRESEFLSDRANKAALLKKAEAEYKAQVIRGDRLTKNFQDNEITLSEKTAELKAAVGTLGEMFGVTRQASAEAYGRISTSIVSAEFPGRGGLLAKMANESSKLPTINELEELWIAMQTEMTQSGKVSRFTTDVVSIDGGSETQSVVRVGTFNLVGEQGYLTYNDVTEQVQPLGRQPDGFQTKTAVGVAEATDGVVPFYADPSQGTILGLLTAKATLSDRYHAGGVPGYTITALFFVGLLIALYKLVQLSAMNGAMRKQLANTTNPNSKNPLGRILKVYQENKSADVENLELKLDEAILREMPTIERGVNIIKIFSAIAPLMGLLGTVIGMINTFQQITLFGTGDPKLLQVVFRWHLLPLHRVLLPHYH